MAAEFTDNLISFLEDKVTEFNPNFSTSEGTAIRDLTVKPFSVIFQPIVDEILATRANLSLSNAANLDDASLDALAANFAVTRKPGAQAVGIVRVFFNQAVDETVPEGTVFLAANGVRFLASSTVTITSAALILNTFGDLFYFDINVQAESAGASGNIPANLIADILTGSDKIVDVANPSPFSGGSDQETNAELLDRLAIAITFRNLINTNGAKLILLQNFLRLLDVFVVGFGDTNTIKGEAVGTGDGVTSIYQLSETEDVIDTSVDVSIAVADELVLSGPGVTAGFKPLDFFPYDPTTLLLNVGASFLAGVPLVAGTDFVAGQKISVADELVATGPVVAGPLTALTFFPVDAAPAASVRAGASWAAGVDLTITTHYTINLATGVITLTSAGATLVNAQTTKDVHVKYSATATSAASFALLASGASAVNSAGTKQLRAKYSAGVLDDSLVAGAYDGSVTFSVVPSAGAAITATFTYYLMRRDRMSGTGLVLGDDTFGTVTHAHIGGRVDYYLKFLGLEEQEVRINGTKAKNFLFVQTTNDPSPASDEQYVSGLPLPIIPRVREGFLDTVIIELVDSGTNLPSGIFLTQVTGTPAGPNEFALDIMPNKLNVNLSTRQKLKLTLSPDVVGSDIFFRYYTHEDFQNVQTFIGDPTNRINTADLLARAPMPVFVDMTVNYSRPNGGPDPAAVQAAMASYINGLKLGKCLSIFGITQALQAAGVQFVELPITLSAVRVNLDFSVVQLSTENKLDVPPNFQFIARTITVNEIELSSCDSIS